MSPALHQHYLAIFVFNISLTFICELERFSHWRIIHELENEICELEIRFLKLTNL